MRMVQDRYNPKKIEAKWQQRWEQSGAHHVPHLAKAKKPYYCTPMLPYPSGDKLHVGHWYNYAPTDSWARYMKMKGHTVFEPMGFDAFGLPAENYAIKTGVHPAESIAKNVATMTEQLQRMGCMYDWERSLNTSSPEYYRWTQWLFLQMFAHGLAYQKAGSVNWCPKDQTVLANEQVVDGKCERCGSEIEQKQMKQWYWKITDYADRLLANHASLDWPEKTIAMQQNWIGRKEGIEITYDVEGTADTIVCFTTRPDTNFGATFIVLAPEHPFVTALIARKEPQSKSVAAYVKKSLGKTERERQEEGRTKTGVFTGYYALNSLNGKKMPIWVSDFVLAGFGTGAVVGVPGHDKRDFEFAQEFDIPVIRVVVGSDGDTSEITSIDQVQEDEGRMMNSGFLDGLDIHDATTKVMDYMEQQGYGKRTITYRLRDWSVSRQRYWGAPIPIVYDPEGNPHAIPEDKLPWLLPTDVDFKPTGVAPLAKSKELKARVEKEFGKGWTPEVDTMDTFVCSSFYTLRYLDPKNADSFVDKKTAAKYIPIAMYTGGPEHATGHLIYARFVHMALYDWGYLTHEEPFQRLVHQGLITYKGAKMSKSKGNVVSPDSFVEQFGSDIFRMYLMFLGPFTDGGDWSDKGIVGIDRFVQRVWRLFTDDSLREDLISTEERAMLHRTIKSTTDSLERLHFNTALSTQMELVNFLYKQERYSVETATQFVQLLAPLAPHLAEELWELLGNTKSVFEESWPTYDPELVVSDTVTIAIQVNGKLRGTIQADAAIDKNTLAELAKAEPNVAKYLEGKKITKEIVVPGKLVNFVC